MVEKCIDEIKRMEKPRKQNENGAKLMKVEEGIGNVGRSRGISIPGSRNAEANGKSLRSLDITAERRLKRREGQGVSSSRGNIGREGGRHPDHLTT
jgi:hypothetical protein